MVFYQNATLTSVTIPGIVTSIGDNAFYECHNLASAAISNGVGNIGNYVFDGCISLTSAIIPGSVTNGWSNTYQGVPAVLWNPQIQASSMHMQSNQVGFHITGTTNIPVLLEACTNLANPVWVPLTNVSLTNGLFQFSEPVQTNSGGRFYRVCFP